MTAAAERDAAPCERPADAPEIDIDFWTLLCEARIIQPRPPHR